MIPIVIPVGAEATYQSGTATYASSAAGITISDLTRVPKLIEFYYQSSSFIFCTLGNYNGSAYTEVYGLDMGSSGAQTSITPTATFSNGTLTLKSGGSRATSGQTWNYKLVY